MVTQLNVSSFLHESRNAEMLYEVGWAHGQGRRGYVTEEEEWSTKRWATRQ